MKKLYSFFLGLAAIAAPAAMADNVATFYVDDPEAVTITTEAYDYNLGQMVASDAFTPLEEVNQYTYPEGQYVYLYIHPKDGYKLASVTKNDGQDVLYGNAFASVSLSDYTNGDVYNITSQDLSSIRTATVTVNIDDASKVRISRGGNTGEIPGLVNGENIIKFDPNTESEFQLGNAIGALPLYQVKYNGDVVPGTNYWSIVVADNSNIDIQANWPDVSYMVKINLPEGCSDLLKGVKDGSSYQDIEGDFTQGVSIKAGTSLSLQLNTTEYAIDKFMVNGVADSYSNTFRVKDADMTFDIEAHKYGTFDITVNLNDASLVSVYQASWNDDSSKLTMNTGDNTVTYQEKQYASYYLAVYPVTGKVLNTFTVKHADAEEAEEITGNSVLVQAGDIITVVAGDKVRDQVINLWVDEAAVANIANIKVSYRDNMTYNLETIYSEDATAGFTTINYNKTELPLTFEVATKHPNPIPENYMPWIPYLCINDLGEGQMSTLQLTSTSFQSGDIIRVFNEQPTMGLVNVSVADDTDATNFEITVDGQLASDWAEDGYFTAFNGAKVSVKWTEPEVEDGYYMTHTCTLDGTPLTEEDGVCSFNTSADNHALVLAEQKNVSVANVAVDNNADEAVYNLQGIRVADNANELNRLPAGIYITGGRKVAVK